MKLYQTVVFNGISISLADLKREIMEKEGLKSTEVDLSISNAQNSEIYKNEQEMISKNSSVIIQRTPLSHSFTRFLDEKLKVFHNLIPHQKKPSVISKVVNRVQCFFVRIQKSKRCFSLELQNEKHF